MVSRCAMVDCRFGRSSLSRLASVPEAVLMFAMESASGSARFFSPVISTSKLLTVESNAS